MKIWCAVDNHNYICHIYVQKQFVSNFNLVDIDKKNQFFTKLAQISHIHKNRNF